jgi:hypothetical protein
MRKFYTSSSVPIKIEIDDKKFTAEKLTIADYHALAAEYVDVDREAIKLKHQEASKGGELSKECINEMGRIVPATPYDLISRLLATHEGYVTTLYTALHKRHPETTYTWVAGLPITDGLVELIYDLLDVRRVMVDKDEKSVKKKNPE